MATSKFSSPPPSSSTALGWFKRDLEQKADRDWVEAKFEALERGLLSIKDRNDDTKSLAIRAKERAEMPHNCSQKELVSRLASLVDGWTKWWRGIFISFIGVFITAGSAALYQYFSLSASVEYTQQSVQEVRSSMSEIQTSQEELRKALEDKIKSDELILKVHLDTITSAIDKGLQDSKKGVRK